MLRGFDIKALGGRIAAHLFVLFNSSQSVFAEVCDKTFAEGNGQYIQGTWLHWQLWLQSYRSVTLILTLLLLLLSFGILRLRLRLLLVGVGSFMTAWSLSFSGIAPVFQLWNFYDWGPIE